MTPTDKTPRVSDDTATEQARDKCHCGRYEIAKWARGVFTLSESHLRDSCTNDITHAAIVAGDEVFCHAGSGAGKTFTVVHGDEPRNPYREKHDPIREDAWEEGYEDAAAHFSLSAESAERSAREAIAEARRDVDSANAARENAEAVLWQIGHASSKNVKGVRDTVHRYFKGRTPQAVAAMSHQLDSANLALAAMEAELVKAREALGHISRGDCACDAPVELARDACIAKGILSRPVSSTEALKAFGMKVVGETCYAITQGEIDPYGSRPVVRDAAIVSRAIGGEQ